MLVKMEDLYVSCIFEYILGFSCNVYICFDFKPSRWGEIRGEKRESLVARCPLMHFLSKPAVKSIRRSTPMRRLTSRSSPGSVLSDGRWEITCFLLRSNLDVVCAPCADPESSFQTMSVKEKGKFEDLAKQDKARYDREMMDYVPAKGGKKKKKFKDPNAPKRPP